MHHLGSSFSSSSHKIALDTTKEDLMNEQIDTTTYSYRKNRKTEVNNLLDDRKQSIPKTD